MLLICRMWSLVHRAVRGDASVPEHCSGGISQFQSHRSEQTELAGCMPAASVGTLHKFVRKFSYRRSRPGQVQANYARLFADR